MTQEDKELLLKDLCARLPYGVKFGIGLAKLGKYDLVEINTKKGKVLFGRGLYTDLENCRPFLRPMSSMNRVEVLEYISLKESIVASDDITYSFETCESIDWLLANHFDFRGLIPMGLALEAPEGMYK